MRCAESLRVQAYFDAEIDAISAADIERHIEHCAECRALLQDLEQVRTALRRDLGAVRAPPALRARVLAALDEEGADALPDVPLGAFPEALPRNTPWQNTPRRERTSATRRLRPFWAGALGGAGGTALAASIALFLLAPRLASPLLDELVSAHVRSLMPTHLIDVVSTDKHTVKPWFAGHADVSPAVADFEQQGYKLIGGRADYFEHQRAAAVVYQHGAHVINVFSWTGPPSGLPKDTTRSGYHLTFWKTGDLVYCAVSDTGWDELLTLKGLLRDLGARDNRD
ncbi:MAG TPA: zf-HC2 domain-containing protein [Steroidobacteraceae bacterium]|nr:zf-HC2 domain-containing protein [Steroidobacteraceae bacterium]